MTTVAKRSISTMFTAAQIDGFSLISSKRNRRKFGGFMTAIAKRLILA